MKTTLVRTRCDAKHHAMSSLPNLPPPSAWHYLTQPLQCAEHIAQSMTMWMRDVIHGSEQTSGDIGDSMLCLAAAANDVGRLEQLVLGQGLPVDKGDYDGRTVRGSRVFHRFQTIAAAEYWTKPAECRRKCRACKRTSMHTDTHACTCTNTRAHTYVHTPMHTHARMQVQNNFTSLISISDSYQRSAER